jgi:predicted phage terminase large subunit-like protein
MWWDVLCLPAEAEREDDPLGRKPGQMIWPEYYDKTHWDQFRIDPILWASLFQQKPRATGANLIDTSKIKRYALGDPHALPRWLNRFVTSDFATKHEDGDFTWHIAWGVDQDGALWMLGGYAEQVRTDKGAAALLDVCSLHKARLAIGEKGPIWNSIEPMVEHFVKTRRKGDRNYRPPRFKMLPSVSSKAVRAMTFQGLVEQGKVHIPSGPLGEKLMDELREFPSDRVHDDGVDCCSLAGRAIMEPGWAQEIPEAVVDEGLRPYSVAWLEYEEKPPSKEGRYV